MKIVILVVLLLLTGCAPSATVIQKAISETQAAYTATPTFTPTCTFTPTVTPTITPSPTPVFAKWNVQQAQDAIIAAGLEFSNPTIMTKNDYGPAPMSATEAIHFLVPSICSDCGGRLYSFANSDDLSLMEHYYTELGRQSALFFSWVFIKDNILIQINGDLSEEQARKYEKVLSDLK